MNLTEAITLVRDGSTPEEISESLLQEMTYSQLYKKSGRARKRRAESVQVRPLKLKYGKDKLLRVEYSYKGSPSVEGIRHKGYVKFLKPLEDPSKWRRAQVEVSCDCRDFKYKWEVANHTEGSARIVYSNGKAPKETNPNFKPGMCKHLIAVRNELKEYLG